MVLEDKEIIPFFEWLQVAGAVFLLMLLVLIAGGIFIGYLVSAFRYGPVRSTT